MLLSRFTFEPSDKDIKWNLVGVVYPSVGSNPSPALPLKVGMVAA